MILDSSDEVGGAEGIMLVPDWCYSTSPAVYPVEEVNLIQATTRGTSINITGTVGPPNSEF